MEDAVEHDAEGVSRVEIGPKVQAYWDAYAKVAGVSRPVGGESGMDAHLGPSPTR